MLRQKTSLIFVHPITLQLQAVSAGLEAGTEFEKSELHLRLLELSKEAHLLRIQLGEGKHIASLSKHFEHLLTHR
jgi:hypothetical protein